MAIMSTVDTVGVVLIPRNATAGYQSQTCVILAVAEWCHVVLGNLVCLAGAHGLCLPISHHDLKIGALRSSLIQRWLALLSCSAST
jgi:hypothetical protein